MFAPNPIATNEIFLNSVAQNHVKYIWDWIWYSCSFLTLRKAAKYLDMNAKFMWNLGQASSDPRNIYSFMKNGTEPTRES